MRQRSCFYVTQCPLETKNSLKGAFMFLKICEILVLSSILEDVGAALHLALNGGRKQVFFCFPEKQMFPPEVQMCLWKIPLSCIFKFRLQ